MNNFLGKFKKSDCQGCTQKNRCGGVDMVLCILEKINEIDKINEENEQ